MMDLKGLHFDVEPLGENRFGIRLFPDSPIFMGHFPGKPVLPGAVMLELLKKYLESVLSVRLRFSSLKTVKFIVPVYPLESDRVVYDYSFDRESGILKSDVYFKDEVCARISAVMACV